MSTCRTTVQCDTHGCCCSLLTLCFTDPRLRTSLFVFGAQRPILTGRCFQFLFRRLVLAARDCFGYPKTFGCHSSTQCACCAEHNGITDLFSARHFFIPVCVGCFSFLFRRLVLVIRPFWTHDRKRLHATTLLAFRPAFGAFNGV